MKVDHFARKTFFSKKNAKNSLFWRTLFRGFLTLGVAVCQTIGPRSTIGVSLKSLGYNGSNQLLGRSMASKLWVHKNQWKTKLFRKSLRTRKFSMGKFFDSSTHEILTHSGFRKCIWKMGTTNVWPCFVRPKLVSATKCGPVAQLWGVKKTSTTTIFKI